MLEIVDKVKHWLKSPGIEQPGPVPYAIACTCGQVIVGQRQPTHQLVPCPKCGETNFVFPLSTLPPISVPVSKSISKASLPRLNGGWSWKAGLIAIAAVALLGGLVIWFLPPRPGSAENREVPASIDVDRRLSDARIEMGQGKFHSALDHLDAALHAPQYEDLPVTRKRDLHQLRLQAALLADLLDVRLGDILRRANDIPQPEWEKVFAHRYLGRSVLFDARVRTDPGGKLRLDYRPFAGEMEARVEVGDLDLMTKLAVDQPVRVIFGARLAGIGKDPRDRTGTLVIHLDPKSGVLLTDRAALESAAPALRDDPDLPRLLKDQQEVVAKLH